MLTLVAFVVALGLLIAVHEYGHYRMAVACGVKVLRFSVGFGKPLLRWHRKGSPTEFVLCALPLGGYVRMLDEREAAVSPAERHLAFNTQPLRSRAAIVAAIRDYVIAVRLDGDMQVRMSANALVWEANLQHQDVLINLSIQLQQDLAIHWSIKEAIQTGQLSLGAPLLVRQHDAPLLLLVNPVVSVGRPVVNARETIAGYLNLQLHAQINPETRQLGLFLTLSHSGLLGCWQSIDPLVGRRCGVWALGAESTMAQWNLGDG